MQSEPSPIQIALTPRFQRDLRELAKRYRSIRSNTKETGFFYENIATAKLVKT
jgi:mRNA-degrading endonuclease RelE of RelBE toxin-antitoxin system